MDHLAGRLRELQFRPASILDFGCGTGTNMPFLLNLNGVTSLLGVDISESSLNIARREIPDNARRVLGPGSIPTGWPL